MVPVAWLGKGVKKWNEEIVVFEAKWLRLLRLKSWTMKQKKSRENSIFCLFFAKNSKMLGIFEKKIRIIGIKENLK